MQDILEEIRQLTRDIRNLSDLEEQRDEHRKSFVAKTEELESLMLSNSFKISYLQKRVKRIELKLKVLARMKLPKPMSATRAGRGGGKGRSGTVSLKRSRRR